MYRRTRTDKAVPVTELVVVIEWRALPTEITRRGYSRDLQV
jgi:hypothetical protein